MDQTAGFAAGSWIVRQPPRVVSIMRVLLYWPLLSALSCPKSVLVINSDSYAAELLVYILLEKYYKV